MEGIMVYGTRRGLPTLLTTNQMRGYRSALVLRLRLGILLRVLAAPKAVSRLSVYMSIVGHVLLKIQKAAMRTMRIV